MDRNVRSQNSPSLLDALQSLDDNGRSRTAAVADGSEAVLAWLQLVEEGGEDAGAGASEGVA